MLKVIHSTRQLKFGQLMRVHEQSNQEKGTLDYPELSSHEQLILVEQEIYAYLYETFFAEKGFYCVWEVDDTYMSALRLEPYKDGLLLTALETLPEARNMGYGKALIGSVLEYLKQQGDFAVYSHVHKNNKASLAVQKACGFECNLNYAVLLDGSVSQKMCTLCFRTKNSVK